jgi:hypothetical protein
VSGRRHALPSGSDYEALRRALAAAGVSQAFIDRLNYDDIDILWGRGYRIERIVPVVRRWEAERRIA